MPNLTPRALQGLKNYQYKSGGYTWLDEIHTPIWNGISHIRFHSICRHQTSDADDRRCQLSRWCAGVVNYLPVWLAPNLITLIGIFGLVIAYLVTLYHLPGLAGTSGCAPNVGVNSL